eukprot:5384681-Pyramimonas_sp.AAC.1
MGESHSGRRGRRPAAGRHGPQPRAPERRGRGRGGRARLGPHCKLGGVRRDGGPRPQRAGGGVR